MANKVDLEPHMSEDQVIRELNLDYVTANPWILIPISALKVGVFFESPLMARLREAVACFVDASVGSVYRC